MMARQLRIARPTLTGGPSETELFCRPCLRSGRESGRPPRLFRSRLPMSAL